MSRNALIGLAALLALAGCSSTAPATQIMPDRKPGLSAPPASMMTPQGY